MSPNPAPTSTTSALRPVHLLAPRTCPIITDGVISIVLTDSYRLHPYVLDPNSQFTATATTTHQPPHLPLRYIFGTDLDTNKVWLNNPLPDGTRAMDRDWVLYFDCNPDLVLERLAEDQNAYLATRKYLGLPELRWARDLRGMAEWQARMVRVSHVSRKGGAEGYREGGSRL